MITNEQFEELILLYIKPLFGIHKVEPCDLACNNCVSQTTDGKIKVSLKKFRASFLLQRNQSFTPAEVALLEKIMISWKETFRSTFDEKLLKTIALYSLQEAISLYISRPSRNVVHKIIDLFDSWASETYEGQKIVFSIGIIDSTHPEATKISIDFFKICSEDYLKVVTSGFDTIVVINSQGHVIKHESLPFPKPDDEEHMLAPLPFLPIASWTEKLQYSICLNRAGEILIFKDKELLLAKRRGKWKFFTHSAYIKSMHIHSENTRNGLKIRKALYVTMLDTSFQRKGACIGFMPRSKSLDKEKIINDFQIIQGNDYLGSTSNKSVLLSTLTNKKNFHELSRNLRQELLSIDGATVILDDGQILSAGAILQIPAGSSGGGRKAAAHVLAHYGLGVKVSNDGKISFWKDLTEETPADEPPIYEIG